MDDEPEGNRRDASASRTAPGCRRVALASVLAVAGFAWGAIALAVGNGPLPVFAIVASAALACFAAAYGLITSRRWAAIMAGAALLGSLGLAYVIYLAIRSAFATYPF